MGSLVMEPDDITSYFQIYHPDENISSICVSMEKIHSRGLFHDNNPLEYSAPLLLAQLSLASAFILFSTSLLKPLGQPSMVMQILGGIALGPSFIGRIYGFTDMIYPFKSLVILDALAMFGNIFYFFLIGVQLDPWALYKINKKELLIGICTVALGMFFSGSSSFILMSNYKSNWDADLITSLPVVATASSVLSFPIVAHYLTELKMVNSRFGRTALSSSIISNMFGFCVISLTFMANNKGNDRLKWTQTICSGSALSAVIIFVVRPIIMGVLRKHSNGEPLKRGFINMIFVGVLVLAFCSHALGLSIFIGPLIFGIIIPAGPPLGSALVEKLDLITSWLFMPLYFVKTGLVTDIFSVDFGNYLIIQFVILMACLGKFLGALISSFFSGLPFRDALSIGLVLNVQGVLELGMFKSIKQSKAINDEAFVVLCISMLVVTASITPILRHLYDPKRRYAAYKRRSVLHLKPNSELKLLVCIYEQENVPATINLLEALNPNRHNPLDICLLHLVELVGRAHPLLIPHKLTKANESYSDHMFTSKNIVNAFKLFQNNYFASVNMHSFTSISPYTSMHDVVCSTAVERKAALIIIPFHKRFAANKKVGISKVGMKIANDKILEMASCSVAMLVDRGGATANNSRELLEYRVAILFVGGPDDREALGIAARMVGQPNVSLTIVRLLEREGNHEHYETTFQRKLDNSVMNEMRTVMAGNFRTMYMEHAVKDGTGTIEVIRSMENLYELIIVGRRHDTRSPLLQGLADWNEDSELGTLADMIALADCNSNTTLLVVHQHINLFDEDWNNDSEVILTRRINGAKTLRSKEAFFARPDM